MFTLAAVWLALAILATILAARLKVSIALTEICFGMAAGFACERLYCTLMMSTGLTFGTISSLYGLTHGIVTREQYSFLVAVVIASTVIPTLVATFAFMPRHLLPAEGRAEGPAAERGDGLGDE
jgi:hypothetical protein